MCIRQSAESLHHQQTFADLDITSHQPLYTFSYHTNPHFLSKCKRGIATRKREFRVIYQACEVACARGLSIHIHRLSFAMRARAWVERQREEETAAGEKYIHKRGYHLLTSAGSEFYSCGCVGRLAFFFPSLSPRNSIRAHAHVKRGGEAQTREGSACVWWRRKTTREGERSFSANSLYCACTRGGSANDELFFYASLVRIGWMNFGMVASSFLFPRLFFRNVRLARKVNLCCGGIWCFLTFDWIWNDTQKRSWARIFFLVSYGSHLSGRKCTRRRVESASDDDNNFWHNKKQFIAVYFVYRWNTQ